jgi:Ca2+/Na+ antiporter
MSELVTIDISHERRTYLKGRFKGKYWALIDDQWSDGKRENYYNIEIYEGEITTKRDGEHFRKWQEGDEFEEYKSHEPFLTKIPSPVICNVLQSDGTVRYYKIELLDVKLSEFHLYNQLHEGEKLFGTIEGDICGYFKHFDVEQIEVLKEDFEDAIEPEQIIDIPDVGTTEIKDDYKRTVVRNVVSGKREWSKWERIPRTTTGRRSSSGFGISDVFGSIIGAIGILYWLFFAFMLISVAWKLLLPIASIWLFFFFLSSLPTILSRLSRWALQLLSLGFLVYAFFGIISLLKNPFPTVKRKIAENTPEEVQRKRTDYYFSDTIISHFRVWNDYQGKKYEAWIEVLKSDYEKAKFNRINLPYGFSNSYDYNKVVHSLKSFDQEKLTLLYSTFDSIKSKNNLNETQFAEMIVSCIQDIPYTLILDNACNALLYDDAFIQGYIKNGGNCEGHIRYGLYSPIEFSGNLLGDCDTRTLLLYTILSHFDYDVAMLGSDVYHHSVLAINLPYSGVSKIINGKRYVLWETTAPDLKPGEIPLEISNTDNWLVNLLSKQIS